MGLSIATFVPEGIVIASDGLAEIRNAAEDHFFLHKKLKRLFIFQNRFMINIHGNGYLKGLPIAYYVDKVFLELEKSKCSNVMEFANAFSNEIVSIINEGSDLSFYVMGIEEDSEMNKRTPILLLWDKGQANIINRGFDNNIVYNYHSVGHGIWLNKLLLPTSFIMEDGEKIDFERVDIDFSKYSLEDAIDFSKEIMSISRKMDNIVQLKQMVGEFITYGILTLDGNFAILND